MKRQGLTLVEMSIVLIVMGLVVGSGTKIFVSLAKNAKIKETKDQLHILSQDIEGFTKLFHRLPTNQEVENFYMKTTDSWGKKIIYIPSKDLLKQVCDVKVSRLAHIEAKKRIENLSFILLSSGPNRNLQTKIENQSITTARYGEVIDHNSDTVDRKQPYDDIYLSRNLWSLHAQINCVNGEK
jgi:prepilin-type N-terminal cleavage/methylation domain-containing protein